MSFTDVLNASYSFCSSWLFQKSSLNDDDFNSSYHVPKTLLKEISIVALRLAQKYETSKTAEFVVHSIFTKMLTKEQLIMKEREYVKPKESAENAFCLPPSVSLTLTCSSTCINRLSLSLGYICPDHRTIFRSAIFSTIFRHRRRSWATTYV